VSVVDDGTATSPKEAASDDDAMTDSDEEALRDDDASSIVDVVMVDVPSFCPASAPTDWDDAEVPPPDKEAPMSVEVTMVDVGAEELDIDGKLNDQLKRMVAFLKTLSPGSVPEKFPQNI
jgi:hypothetical protein